MNIRRLQNGNLEMTADCNEQSEISALLATNPDQTMIAKEASFISDYLPDYQQVSPEEVGALTGAPLISDGNRIYGFMDYAVVNFLERLAEGRMIIWQKG